MVLTERQKELLTIVIDSNKWVMNPCRDDPSMNYIICQLPDNIFDAFAKEFGGSKACNNVKHLYDTTEWSPWSPNSSEKRYLETLEFAKKLDYMLMRHDPEYRRSWLHRFFPELIPAPFRRKA